MTKNVPSIAFILITTLFCWNIFEKFRDEKRETNNLYFGTKANEIRTKFNIPIIEDDMISKSLYNGHRWDSPGKFPNDREALHLWKIVTLPKYFGSIYEEKDAFRKKYNDTLYQQLNIFTRISCDTVVKSQGSLFFVDKADYPRINLNKAQLDSVAQSWGILYHYKVPR
jgi:hypothetical protein